MQIAHLLNEYGEAAIYPLTFAWTALEGETFVIFAGFLAQKGKLNIELLFLAAWLGSMFGDQVLFAVGRQYGVKFFDHFPRLKPGVLRAVSWLERHAVLFILSYRFMYGVRNVSSIAVGMSHMPWKRFAVLNAIAAFIWAGSFVGFGYLFGHLIRHRREDTVATSVHEITLGVLAVFAFIIIMRLAVMWVVRYLKARHSTESVKPPDDKVIK